MTTHIIFPSDGNDPYPPNGDEVALYNKLGRLYARSAVGIQPLIGYSRGYAQLVEEQPTGTSGGTVPYATTWFIRNINTIRYNEGIVDKLVNNVWTMLAGTYDVLAWVPIIPNNNGVAAARIWSTFLHLQGQGSTAATQGIWIMGRVKFLKPTNLRLECFVSSSASLGTAIGVGPVETYSIVNFWKVE